MIKKQERLIITFHTTVDAMAMETLCKSLGADGRIIPVPTSITAGCGLAWSAKPGSEDALRGLMKENGITYQDIQVCLI